MQTQFWNGLHLLKRLYDQSLAPLLEGSGMTRMELDILLFLANNPAFDTAAGIIEQRRLAKSHVSTSVHALVERGYLKPWYQPDNKRRVHLRVLPAAEPLVEQGRAAQRDFFAAIYNGLSGEEIAVIERSFIRIAGNARAALE